MTWQKNSWLPQFFEFRPEILHAYFWMHMQSNNDKKNIDFLTHLQEKLPLSGTQKSSCPNSSKTWFLVRPWILGSWCTTTIQLHTRLSTRKNFWRKRKLYCWNTLYIVYPHSTEYCRYMSEIFPIFYCNWNIVAIFLSNIAKYFIAVLQFWFSEIFSKTNKYLVDLEIL